MSSFLDCHVTLMNQLETLGTGTWSTYDEAGALRDWAIIIPSAYPRSSPLPYAGIRSRRCWLAAPTGSASGMGVTDLDLDPVSRMSESSGSYACLHARDRIRLSQADCKPWSTSPHSCRNQSFDRLLPARRTRIWMRPAFGRRPIPPLSHRDRENARANGYAEGVTAAEARQDGTGAFRTRASHLRRHARTGLPRRRHQGPTVPLSSLLWMQIASSLLCP